MSDDEFDVSDGWSITMGPAKDDGWCPPPPTAPTERSEGGWSPLQQNAQRRADFFADHAYVLCYAFETSPTHWVDFAIYEVMGSTMPSDGPRALIYPLIGGTSFPKDSTTDLNKAQPLLEGFVKWDGCTQFRYPDGVHIDGLEQLRALHAAVEEIRRVAMVEIIREKAFGSEYPSE